MDSLLWHAEDGIDKWKEELKSHPKVDGVVIGGGIRTAIHGSVAGAADRGCAHQCTSGKDHIQHYAW